MRELYRKRHRAYQKELIKYSKYIINDHFSIVLLFLIGGLSYYYVQILEMVEVGNLFAKLAIMIAMLLILQLGKLNLLVEAADMTFLLVKEKKMSIYFREALKSSMLFPILVNFLLVLIITPLYIRSTGFPVYSVIALFILQIFEKILFNQLKINSFYQKKQALLWTFYAQLIVLIIFSQFISPIFVLLFAIVIASILLNISSQSVGLLNWELIINYEAQRKRRVYQFISMFTDVPNLPVKVARKKYFDFLLREKDYTTQKTYLYLFKHAFFRNNDYFNLALRLNLINILVVFSVNDIRIAALANLVILYLIGFQMIPLYRHFDNHVLAAIYPVARKYKRVALIKIIFSIMTVSAFISVILAFIHFDWQLVLLNFVISLIFIVIFCHFYLPKRID
ncbi:MULTISPECIES: ABC transporter permease [unclassified Enterococcus]|uniref:ABC transporter permease n=1 Tax=unclassified Enterococcus TaxID=2608891 RepID=UPI001553DBEB|nr:ABC transporter permease [Enterococcus sp. MMGLQ5-2]MBS7583992.1 ABC transporter permease [Enterococcus sp. MMGLQ5-1]NPD11853.1 ABC transporter permease [Enterococcus sp. MMGLQ5-1]NPD36358.1 ABC transporter permease [Enterococcus sp. MMGLQ5-2]